MYTVEYYSAIKKNETFIATWMDLKNITVSEVRQRRINVIQYHLYMDSKLIQINLYTKQKKIHIEIKLIDNRGEREGSGYKVGVLD